MSLEVKSQVILSKEGKVKFWVPSTKGRRHFHLGVWIDGSVEELNRIDHVEYLLHDSFKKPLRRSENRDNKFSVTFWTWGMFTIRVTISFHDGSTKVINYYLSYVLPTDKDAYVQVLE
jgi:transcription initiation factor IIF auxiliary subunit